MCNSIFNHRLAPVNEKHLTSIQNTFPDQAAFAQKVYSVITDGLRPQVNLLVAFTILKYQFDKNSKGIFSAFGKVLYAPLSIVAKTGEHEWTRFRPKEVDELHTSFLSFMMAKPNRESLNALFNDYGLCFSQGHCCGILFGDMKDVSIYEKSELFKTRNVVRSYAESMAMPVKEIGFDDIPLVTSDLGAAEREFYLLYEHAFLQMSAQDVKDYKDNSIDGLWNALISKIVNPLVIKDSKELVEKNY